MNRGEFAKAQSLFLECAAIWNGAGCVLRAPVGLLFAGDCAFRLLDFAGARRLLDAALIQHRRMGNVHDAATALRMLGELELNERRFAEARAHCAESVRVFRALQDRSCGGYAAEAYAAALFAQDDHAAALREAEAAAAAFRELGAVRDHALAGVLGLTASIRLALGERDAARQALRDALVVQRRTHRDHGLPELLEKVAAMNPDARSAPALLGIASALREQWHVPVFPGEREEYERCYADVRAKHDADEFQRALAAGRTLERETAMETALTLVGDDRLTAPR
jgi:tetratricopeptide (TPR) repeat protein